MKYEIKLDLKGLNKTLEEIQDAIEQGTEIGLKQVASKIKQMEHDIIDSNIGGDGTYVRTGKLKSSITIMPITWSNWLAEISIVPKGYGDIPYFNELGTGIYADNGNGRKDGWVYPLGNGEFRFTMGLPPKYFVRDTREFYSDKASRFIEDNIYRLLNFN